MIILKYICLCQNFSVILDFFFTNFINKYFVDKCLAKCIFSHINTILVFYLYLFLFVFIRLCSCVFLKWQSYYSSFCCNLRCTVDVANSLKWWVVLQAKESFLLSSESSSEKTPAAVSELWENTETTLTTVSAAWAHTVMCRGLRSQTLSESGPAVCCTAPKLRRV